LQVNRGRRKSIGTCEKARYDDITFYLYMFGQTKIVGLIYNWHSQFQTLVYTILVIQHRAHGSFFSKQNGTG
ncbi:hypothetical protein ACJX0J_040310, partial [Zea mays]